jgi:hypothetical protein
MLKNFIKSVVEEKVHEMEDELYARVVSKFQEIVKRNLKDLVLEFVTNNKTTETEYSFFGRTREVTTVAGDIKAAVLAHIDEEMDKRVDLATSQKIHGEKFIDSLVVRILKKQLKSVA